MPANAHNPANDEKITDRAEPQNLNNQFLLIVVNPNGIVVPANITKLFSLFKLQSLTLLGAVNGANTQFDLPPGVTPYGEWLLFWDDGLVNKNNYTWDVNNKRFTLVNFLPSEGILQGVGIGVDS